MFFESLKKLEGFTLQATDGEIGKVSDFYFDDDQWTIRYMVADTSDWLGGRKVLIATDALGEPDQVSRVFPVHLTRQQVQDAPGIGADLPFDRQEESELRQYYGWPVYWNTGESPEIGAGVAPFPVAVQPVPVTGQNASPNRGEGEDMAEGATPVEFRSNPNMRSFNEVHGYHINADDGEIGRVDDFIVDHIKWNMLYMIVEAGGLFSSRKVLVSPNWIQAVSWHDKVIDVDLKKDTIKNSPEYTPGMPLDQQYEENLYRYYGKPFNRQ